MRARRVGVTLAAGCAVGIMLATTGLAGSATASSVPLMGRPAAFHPQLTRNMAVTPLTNPVVTAMLVQGHPAEKVAGTNPRQISPVKPVKRSSEEAGREADAVHEAAVSTALGLLDGSQTVYVRESAGEPFRTVTARTSTRPEGTSVRFPDGTTSFVPTPMPTDELAQPGRVVWTIADSDEILGRPTVQLTSRVGDPTGPVANRYWLDASTHQVLWQQSYAPSGDILVSAGYRSIA